MKNQKHVVSWSGGKDSTAMLLRMLEIGMPVNMILFADTRHEFKAMYEYQRFFRSWLKANYPHIKQATARTPDTFEYWLTGKITRGKREGDQRGWPLKVFPCYWTREAKFKVLDPVCKGNERYIGYAADEPQRWKSGIENGYNCPLVDWGWDEDECLKYLDVRKLSCQLHHDFNRTGCYFCPKQPKKNMETIYRLYPEEWKKMLDLEALANNEWNPGISLKQMQDIFEDQMLFGFMAKSA